ncbi:MAG: transporter [Rhodospirillaceae bacterium]|nr:transporter [Rhodospirillaceae bacterium]
MEPVINVVLPVFAIILSGYIAGRAGVMGPASTDALNRFVYYVALPVLLGHSMARVDAATIFDLPFIFAYIGGCAVTFAGAYFLSRLAFKNDMAQSSLFAMVSMFANTGYMGIPLAIVAFGPDTALPAAIATVFQTLVFIAVAEVLVAAGRSQGTGQALAKVYIDSLWGLLKSPLFIGCAIGMGWSLSGLKIPVPVDTYATVLGAAAGPGALFALGLFLVGKPISEGIGEVSVMVAIKLLVHPAVTWVLGAYVFDVRLDWLIVLVMLAALPTGASCFVLAQQQNIYIRRTSSVTLFSTLVALLTIGAFFALPQVADALQP